MSNNTRFFLFRVFFSYYSFTGRTEKPQARGNNTLFTPTFAPGGETRLSQKLKHGALFLFAAVAVQ